MGIANMYFDWLTPELALRDWRLFSGQKLIGLATSGWLMIDIRNRRPLRPGSPAGRPPGSNLCS